MTNRIYLDYAATTPVAQEVYEAMRPYFSEKYGNPGSLHSFGQEALAAVDRAREAIAGALSVSFQEIIFTGSATEANNLALRGVVKRIKNQESGIKEPKIIVSSVEHKSVLETAHDLEHEGVEIVELPVNEEGLVDVNVLRTTLDENTVLVSVMYVNNETGVAEPIDEIARIIKEFRHQASNVERQTSNYPLFHTDASHALQHLPCNVSELGVDMATLCAHKIYGPKGIGALYVKTQSTEPYPLVSVITGGEREFGLRSGTENVPGIVGFGRAVELVAQKKAGEFERVQFLLKRFVDGVKRVYPRADVNGPAPDAPHRAPHIVNIYFPEKRAEELLIKLDMAGVAASTGAACRARAVEPPFVLRAMGHSKERALASLRFSFGAQTTEKEIDDAVQRLGGALQ